MTREYYSFTYNLCQLQGRCEKQELINCMYTRGRVKKKKKGLIKNPHLNVPM